MCCQFYSPPYNKNLWSKNSRSEVQYLSNLSKIFHLYKNVTIYLGRIYNVVRHLLSLAIYSNLIWNKFLNYLAEYAPTNNGSILIPGPIVNEIATVLKYWPFDASGFNFIIWSIATLKFSTIASLEKSTLPIGKCIDPNLSTLKAIFPFLNSDTVLSTFVVTGP